MPTSRFELSLLSESEKIDYLIAVLRAMKKIHLKDKTINNEYDDLSLYSFRKSPDGQLSVIFDPVDYLTEYDLKIRRQTGYRRYELHVALNLMVFQNNIN